MTSMLYIRFVMNNKPNVPGEIFLGNADYTWRMDWEVNGWLFVATIISALADIMFPHVVRQWPVEARIGIVFAEFLAIALWTGSLARWIRGMDEMHRRITVAAVLCSIGATFFCLMLWHRLEQGGLFNATFSPPEGDPKTV